MITRTFIPDTIHAHPGPVTVPPQAEVKIQIDIKDPSWKIKEVFYTTVTGKKSVSITDKVIVSSISGIFGFLIRIPRMPQLLITL
ncbi:hypothetical protein [Brevibacillus sp. DP1.3A]|uniref:hypothetical protein n=1 Tax=Brevibacillus sp. DP1.3A TaxID=2738867 RepID=UPI00156BD265|nr:hypothetical protein [Brevibacillus sp. DP1.3A]UED76368.1 hypothetical protein HP399_007680 [Brevibacillus sp. DP1.3A]